MILISNLILLLWKNYLLQLRHPWMTLFEILIPSAFVAIVAVVRIQIEANYYNTTSYNEFDFYNIPPINAHISNFPQFNAYQYIIIYSPNTTKVEKVMENVLIKLNSHQSQQFIALGFENDELLVKYYNHLVINEINLTSSVFCALVFDNKLKDFETELNVKIRFPSSPSHQKQGDLPYKWWYTNYAYPKHWKPGPREKMINTGGIPGYYEEGFMSIEHVVAMAVSNVTFQKNSDSFRFVALRFPFGPYLNNLFLYHMQFLFPVIFMFCFVYPAVNQTKNIVLEKEKRIKELMKMMGLQVWLHWLAWFIKSLIWLSISSAIITLILCIKLQNNLGILNYSEWTVIYFFFFIYSIATISFSFMLSTFFTKANIAGIGAGAIFFLTFIPYFAIADKYFTLSFHEKLWSCLISNIGLAFGTLIISDDGIDWNSITEEHVRNNTFALIHVNIMHIIDTIIYLTITWYIDSLFPGEYGIPLKWYFPITKSYWCRKQANQHYNGNGSINSGFIFDNISISKLENFEEEPNGLEMAIKINNLSKTFNSGKTFAVKNLNFTSYMGQITSLLGHNGAGKTTIMSMLTGLYPPSSGTAYVNGIDIRDNNNALYSSIGICPQFDILFDELTVKEHLIFFCKLKRLDSKLVKNEIERMIKVLALEDKQNSQTKSLSGGMKRKLSVGIALVGGSKIVFLDEPTSGMDVSARRFMWDLLLQEKQNRAILLTTHFMEEADVLGDRIAIIADGELQCYGTSIFLKRKFGVGYHLTITTKSISNDNTMITNAVSRHIKNCQLETMVGTEISYSLPNEQRSQFESLFTELDHNKNKLGINGYGISMTTLEEVFLKIGKYAKEKIDWLNKNHYKFNKSHQLFSIKTENKDRTNTKLLNSGINLFVEQFKALLIKKILFTYRNRLLTLSQLLLPLIFTITAILIIKATSNDEDSPQLLLDLEPFRGITVPYFFSDKQNQNQLIDNLANYYEKAFADSNDTHRVKLSNQNITDNAIKFLLEIPTNLSMWIPISVIFDNSTVNTTITAMFNNQAYHSPAISLAVVHNATMKLLSNNADYKLQMSNYPLPPTPYDILQQSQYLFEDLFLIILCIIFSMSFMTASFSVLLVKELSLKSKHLQQICGTKLYIYWLSTILWDFFIYLLPAITIMLSFVIFKQEGYNTHEQQFRLFALFIIFGLTILPLTYVMSHMFEEMSTAYIRISIYCIFTGIAPFLCVYITEIPDFNIISVTNGLDFTFSLLFPNYCLSRSLYNLYNNLIGNQKCNSDYFQIACNSDSVNINPEIIKCCKGKCGDSCHGWQSNFFSLEMPGIGRQIMFLFIQMIIYWIIIIMIEFRVFHNLKYVYLNLKTKLSKSNCRANLNVTNVCFANNYDEQILEEQNRIEKSNLEQLTETDALIIRNLIKYYGSTCAVNNISFGVRRGECFGLLGVNGAGKTSTFKMITTDQTITSGDIFVNGFNVKTNAQKVQQQIGYCPQFDGLLDHLTGRETLTLFCRLKGFKEYDLSAQIEETSKLLYFDDHIDKLVTHYSGGTKRKLSAALALIGEPAISFLDEPTTGVDPVARRCVWDALIKKLSNGCSIVLTSHSMEECEALCNRIIIMVNGRICCIGSPQQLKNKFGKGYSVMIKVSSNRSQSHICDKKNSFPNICCHQNIPNSSDKLLDQNIENLKNFMSISFNGSQLKTVHNNILYYNITDESLKLSQIFGCIERSKYNLNIEDYSVVQTTLEQIFLSFASKQQEAN